MSKDPREEARKAWLEWTEEDRRTEIAAYQAISATRATSKGDFLFATVDPAVRDLREAPFHRRDLDEPVALTNGERWALAETLALGGMRGCDVPFFIDKLATVGAHIDRVRRLLMLFELGCGHEEHDEECLVCLTLNAYKEER